VFIDGTREVVPTVARNVTAPADWSSTASSTAGR